MFQKNFNRLQLFETSPALYRCKRENGALLVKEVKIDISNIREVHTPSSDTQYLMYHNDTGSVATTATTAGNEWINIDPDCGYDGWADAYPTIDPNYDPTLYWTEEDWAIARSLRFE